MDRGLEASFGPVRGLLGVEESSVLTYNCDSEPTRCVPFASMLRAEGEWFVQIKISMRHGHLSEDSQAFIQEKAKKLMRLFERLTMIEVTVDMQNGDCAV